MKWRSEPQVTQRVAAYGVIKNILTSGSSILFLGRHSAGVGILKENHSLKYVQFQVTLRPEVDRLEAEGEPEEEPAKAILLLTLVQRMCK